MGAEVVVQASAGWRYEPGARGGIFVIRKRPIFIMALIFGASLAGTAVSSVFAWSRLVPWVGVGPSCLFELPFLCLGLILCYCTVMALGLIPEAVWLSGSTLCVGMLPLGFRVALRRHRLAGVVISEVPDPPPPAAPAAVYGGALTVTGGEGALRAADAAPAAGGLPSGGEATPGLLLRAGNRRYRLGPDLDAGQAAALARELALRFGVRCE